jgi:hypothetical protein
MHVVGEREGKTMHMRLPDGRLFLSSRLIRAKTETEMECTFELHLDGNSALTTERFIAWSQKAIAAN